MKLPKFLTKFTLIGALLCALAPAALSQQPLSVNVTNGVNLVRSGGTAIFELQITDTSASANTISIFDNSSSTSTNTVKSAYISYAYSRSTNSTTFTNLAGVVQTNNFIYLSRAATTNAAATNAAPLIYKTVVPSGGTITISPLNPFTFGLGFQVYASSNAAINALYTPMP